MNSNIKTKIKNFAGFCAAVLLILSNNVFAEKFTVTSYYSPLPKQEFYITGDYKSEIRLNGKGIAGADGTPVFNGMIAAPKNYKFGTKICLDGLGCGSVHDRGGAIVNKGERKKARHDRIDYWMGHGTSGLERSLDWGVRHVNGSFSHGSARQRNLRERRTDLPQIVLEIIREENLAKLFTKNLYPGTKSEEVIKLKEALSFLKFFRGNLEENIYDNQVKKSVLNFQLKYEVISNETERGAGNFGPKTREKMKKILQSSVNDFFRNKWKISVFRENLSLDDHDMDVFRLQQLLIDKGFLDSSTTGYFGPKTKKALEEFQIEYGIVKNKNSQGAGNFGPKTREKMKELWIAKRDSYFPKNENIQVAVVEKKKEESHLVAEAGIKLDFFRPIAVGEKPAVKEVFQFGDKVKLFRGKRNEDVRQLQKVLKKQGFFAGNPTGFYGDKTAEAVLAFQFKHKIVSSRKSVGASVFGPSTKNRMNHILRNL